MQTNAQRNQEKNFSNDVGETLTSFFRNKEKNEPGTKDGMGKDSKITKAITKQEAENLRMMAEVLSNEKIENVPSNYVTLPYTTDYQSVVERYLCKYVEIFQNLHHFAYREEDYERAHELFVNEIYEDQQRRFGNNTNFVYLPIPWGEMEEEFCLKYRQFLDELVNRCGGENGYDYVLFDELTDETCFRKEKLEGKAVVLIGDILQSDGKNLKRAITQLEEIDAYPICSYFIAKEK